VKIRLDFGALFNRLQEVVVKGLEYYEGERALPPAMRKSSNPTLKRFRIGVPQSTATALRLGSSCRLATTLILFFCAVRRAARGLPEDRKRRKAL
jgi:hypothetical protein